LRANKLSAGEPFPTIKVKKLGGGEIDLGVPGSLYDWRLVIIYRGKWCPFCTEYLTELKGLVSGFNEQGLDVVAVSADTEAWAQSHADDVQPNFEVGFGLTVEQMERLGVYISNPYSDAEPATPFAEPALFVINENGLAQIIDISNIAFARPDLKTLLRGLQHIRSPGKNYPIRGTFSSTE